MNHHDRVVDKLKAIDLKGRQSSNDPYLIVKEYQEILDVLNDDEIALIHDDEDLASTMRTKDNLETEFLYYNELKDHCDVCEHCSPHKKGIHEIVSIMTKIIKRIDFLIKDYQIKQQAERVYENRKDWDWKSVDLSALNLKEQ